ncbi:RNA polymerase sigma-70 factor, ECF subfamily [Tenacibaculum sp. MAR_2009_124]|uniref:RNA polymerase sigma factor n=1 Tax=Tenacibaculum sp. MAR_2009_124 TaxID=1250059 RepID=UPI0008995C28|nr:sigma-70 family RNA polymerase sigma factor [Tenacibaculum sp. MAR_2009_124]SEB39442.1 RNA polymerase sigma-70 factor, ECF subfamily [Tenacibaculum sp. MAR_2009_124]
MKVISLHNAKIFDTIKKACKNDRESQKEIFKMYSPKMLSVCRQYVKDDYHAEEMMLSGFMKVFSNIKKFKNEGSFEGWIRRIMVNTCLSHLKRKTIFEYTDEEYVFNNETVENLENTSVEDIQNLIDKLPDGYKVVFTLFAIEGYKHSEIAKMLDITESTSKSQLFKARKSLQSSYLKMNKLKNEER